MYFWKWYPRQLWLLGLMVELNTAENITLENKIPRSNIWQNIEDWRPNMGFVKYMNSRGCFVLLYIRKTTIIIEMQVEQLGKATKKGGGPICPWQPSGHLQQKSLWNIVQTNHSFQNQWWQLQIQHKQVWCHHVIYLRKEPWQFDKRSVISGSCYILWNQMSVNFFTSSFVHMILRERSFVRLGRRCIQESR